ncbi:uncharacterized protein [Watersipora subatra]|uniref:uncharacterized protein n=1 Tax=Watersipora subatra TaxID=2589382 RepID=UPI00355B19D6
MASKTRETEYLLCKRSLMDYKLKRLEDIYEDVMELWEELDPSISFADFVVLVGTTAVEKGMAQSGGPGKRNIPFRTGRTTCADPEEYEQNHQFPRGEDPESLSFLMTEFGLSKKQAVALMGAHSLGRCREDNSGFEGPWDETPQTLDNGYYRSLVNTKFDLEEASNGFTQWSKDETMMLHADMSLRRNLGISSGETPECLTSNDCPLNASINKQVKSYARDQKMWADDFESAFLLMVEH